MPTNLKWTPEREEFYGQRPHSSLEGLASMVMLDRRAAEDWIDAEARGAIVPHRASQGKG